MADKGLKPPSQAGGAHTGAGHGGGQGGGQFGIHFMGPGPAITGAPGGGIMGIGRATGTLMGGHIPPGPHWEALTSETSSETPETTQTQRQKMKKRTTIPVLLERKRIAKLKWFTCNCGVVYHFASSESTIIINRLNKIMVGNDVLHNIS